MGIVLEEGDSTENENCKKVGDVTYLPNIVCVCVSHPIVGEVS